MTQPFVILCLHRILPESYRNGPDAAYFLRQTALSLERFRLLLDDIERHADILPPEVLIDGCFDGRAWNRPAVVLTFDDGYADIVIFALPELRRRNLRAAVCVTTATFTAGYVFPVDRWYATLHAAKVRRGTLVGFGEEPWLFDLNVEGDVARFIDGPEKRAFVRANPDLQEKLRALLAESLGVEQTSATPKWLNRRELTTLVNEGFLLGAHGHRHQHLPELPEVDAKNELRQCRAFFPANDLPTPTILAYPDGATCERTESLARAAGFSVGLALGSRAVTKSDSWMHLPRFIPTNDPTWFERRLGPILRGATH